MGAITRTMLHAVFLMLLFGTSFAQAEETCSQPIANLTSLQGQVDVRINTAGTWHPAVLNDPLCGGNEIRTGRLSRAQIRLHQNAPGTSRDGTLMQLKEISSLVLPKIENPSLIDLLRGQIHVLTRTPKSLTIKTLFCNANVEGTEFLVQADTDNTKVSVYEGQVRVDNDLGSTQLTAGEVAIAEPNKAPRREILIKPRDAVQWALYYPPIIDTRSAPPGPNQSLYRRALDLYKQGQIAEAISILDKLADSQHEPYYYELRAALYLSVGQVDYARKELVAAITMNANDANAYALESIIALVQNHKDKAQEYAKRAIEADEKSPTAWVADSYAQQATFKLDVALESAKQSVKLSPENALSWARVSELELAHGNLGKADKAGDKARSLDPTLARTQTISGFAALTRVDIPKAMTAFTEAIRLDPADPLPRLGQGLAKIRKGELTEGRKDIEDAANIDLDNALVRSYLGKAYYEEKRNDLAAKELENAKVLDPKDPTPWFYDAILKQTENRPLEALNDLQKSTELNENRATYRSKLYLDQDLAARSAAQGRIYRDLGFQQRALVEGWHSINTNLIDYSGHRLLSDSYSVLPRHEIARVSELLQSQLLQPINITPIQPRLAESSFLSFESLGVSAPAFNEFNPLFVRNRSSLQISGLAGSHDTFGDEVVLSGIYDGLSYSVGQLHQQTNGFRQNNGAHENLVTAFVQTNISSNLNVQAEFRRREIEKGDLSFSDIDSHIPSDSNLRTDLNSDTFRIGAHYNPNVNSDFIMSFIHLDGDNRNQFTDGSVVTESETTYGNLGEAQYTFKVNDIRGIAGIGYSASGLALKESPETPTRTKHSNGYVYTYLEWPRNAVWTFGLSVDSLQRDFLSDYDQRNPKLGLIWRVAPNTTLRAAIFRVLKRSLLTNQTIEPTQVAGFNQFYDDLSGTDAWSYGVAIDHKFSASVFGGIQFIDRILRIQFPTDQFANWSEHSIRSYFYWNIGSSLAASLTFQRDEFEGGRFLQKTSNTNTSEVGLRYFHHDGMFARIDVTYVNQDVFRLGETSYATSNDFVVCNVGFGFRLPRRHGIIGVEVKNLTDSFFNVDGLGIRSTGNDGVSLFPERSVFAYFTLAF
jgi:tetratricopeptide (TPR) repeat protein